jgi:hypothetical protein
MTLIPEAERATLLRIHAEDQLAHLATDVDRLMAHQGDLLITVAQGRVDEITRAQVREHFTQYFAGATYQEYADLEPPRVELSSDATLAWIISRTRVRRTTRHPDGTTTERQFVYAGFMGYARRAGRWLRIANVATFETS